MSRRRGEFEHRTSIFEGAFRAWSHLGGLDPEDLESKPASELDPLANPIVNDPRITGKSTTKNPDGTARREYPYEPLPRSGLAHPYVQAILSPWLGPDADNEAIQLGLTTLRTWWQHRRKGESGSAIAALGTEKMKGVVEGYTRHFFTLAHCIVVNDKVQPPRGLHAKMKEIEKIRSKQNKKSKKSPIADASVLNAGLRADLTDPNLTPLEKLHYAQRRQLESQGPSDPYQKPLINVKGKCLPGKINLPGVVDAVTRQASQMVYRGATSVATPAVATSSSTPAALGATPQEPQYGDPNRTPVVFVSSNGDIQIAMRVDGITCAHCVKIVETVLRGCNGNKSPISGLLDAAADRDLCSVLIKIDKSSNAKRIAFEASRNLSMVGYTAEAKSMSIVDGDARTDIGALTAAFEVVATTDPEDVFDWSAPCTCPDNGILRSDCPRHSQMNTRIFEAFERRENQVKKHMAGCGMKYGMNCSCGPNCTCEDCPDHPHNGSHSQQNQRQPQAQVPIQMPVPLQQQAAGVPQQHMPMVMAPNQPLPTIGDDEAPLQVDQQLVFSNFGMAPPTAPVPHATHTMGAPAPVMNGLPFSNGVAQSMQQQQAPPQSNPTVLAFGNNGLRSSVRGMSITSETTFGRAMSGLSALSIDWENLDDFDLDVDHSAHINQGGRRTSIRRSIMSSGSQDASNPNSHAPHNFTGQVLAGADAVTTVGETRTMKLLVKTLNGQRFDVDVEESTTIEHVKGLIEQKKSDMPAAQLKLIHSGKVLKDADTVGGCGIKEKDFLVVMITKAKKKPVAPKVDTAPPAAAPAPPAEATPKNEEAKTAEPPAATPAAPAATTTPAAPTRTDNVSAEAVANLTAMGFPEAEVRHCLRVAHGNPDVAVEFLTNGIPEGMEHAANIVNATANTPAAPAPANAGGPLQALRNHPQFAALRRMVQTNPGSLQQILTQIGQQQPALLAEINSNQAAFLEMMNEPITDAPAPGAGGGDGAPRVGGGAAQMAQMMQNMSEPEIQQMAQMMGMSPDQLRATAQAIGRMPPEELNQFMMQSMGAAGGGMLGGGGGGGPQVLELTPEEMEAVNRLTAMGFDRTEAVQAFLACDKDEALAANLLMDSMGSGGIFGTGGGAPGGDNSGGGAGGGSNDDDDNMYD